MFKRLLNRVNFLFQAQVKRWSNPGMAIHVAAQIAAIKNIRIDQVLYWTRRNTNNVYGI